MKAYKELESINGKQALIRHGPCIAIPRYKNRPLVTTWSQGDKVPDVKNRLKVKLDQMFFLLDGLSQTKPKLGKHAGLIYYHSVMGWLRWELWPVAAEPALRLLMGLWEWEGLTPDCSKNAERGLQPGDERCCPKVNPW